MTTKDALYCMIVEKKKIRCTFWKPGTYIYYQHGGIYNQDFQMIDDAVFEQMGTADVWSVYMPPIISGKDALYQALMGNPVARENWHLPGHFYVFVKRGDGIGQFRDEDEIPVPYQEIRQEFLEHNDWFLVKGGDDSWD